MIRSHGICKRNIHPNAFIILSTLPVPTCYAEPPIVEASPALSFLTQHITKREAQDSDFGETAWHSP